MKNNYEKCIREVFDMKDKTYKDFKKSGFKSFGDFIKHELKGNRLTHGRKRIA